MKVLIVARHPSAGGGAIALAAEARRRHFGVEIFASGPALTSLTAQHVRGVSSFAAARRGSRPLPAYRGPERFEWPGGPHTQSAIEGMADWLTRYVVSSQADAVIATDATEQLGPDQLIAIAASRAGIPCVRVRDAWGIAAGLETRPWRGRVAAGLRRESLASLYLEIDHVGVELSRRVLGLPSERLRSLDGLYTLDRFAGSATATRRGRARRSLGIGLREPVVLLFTQPTRRETAEVDFVEVFVHAMTRQRLAERGVVLVTLEHPRESDASDGRFGAHWTAACAGAGYRGRVIDLAGRLTGAPGFTFEDAMIAADVVASSYSNASIEATALGATGRGLATEHRPIGLHSYAPATVRRVFRRSRAGLRMVPMAAGGALPCAETRRAIGPLVSRLLFQPRTREPYFRRLRQQWHAGSATARVMDEVVAAVRTS